MNKIHSLAKGANKATDIAYLKRASYQCSSGLLPNQRPSRCLPLGHYQITTARRLSHPQRQRDRSHVPPIPKGHNLPHFGLTTVYDRTNHSKSAPPYPRRQYDAVQSDAPTREPPHTQLGSRQHSHTERENIDIPFVRRNPSASLTRVPKPNEEKLQHD
ncbi:hypothetical protein NDI49_05375 [Trichocoleus sp. ST-U3]